MELSLFLAKLIGLTYVLFALGALARPRVIPRILRDFNSNSFTTLIAGMMALVIGLAMVISHNVWEGSWRVLITLMGWAALLKGVAYIFIPSSIMGTAESLLNTPVKARVVLIIALLFGAYLTYKGFGM